MAAVRLLMRRTGVRRPAPRQDLILEVEEVFRIDVIAAVFENRFPDLRVTFRFTQPDVDRDLEADYPLELPEENFRPGRDPVDHAARAPARAIWRVIFHADPTDYPGLDNVLDLVDLYGPGPEADCNALRPPGSDADYIWTVPGLLESHEFLIRLEDVEQELSRELIDWFIDHWPSHAFVALAHYDDVVSLMNLRAYVQDPRNHHFPYHLCGDNEQLRLL